MAATQALKEVLADGVAADTIVRVGVAVLPPHLKMIDHGVTSGDRFSHLTSVQYQMAVAALAPDLAYGSARRRADLAGILALMERIKVRAEDSLLTAGYPHAWPAHVTVHAAKRRERSVVHVPGDPARPFNADELKAKFLRVIAPVFGEGRAEARSLRRSAGSQPCGSCRRDRPAAVGIPGKVGTGFPKRTRKLQSP